MRQTRVWGIVYVTAGIKRTMAAATPGVFVEYGSDSPAHRDRVLGVAMIRPGRAGLSGAASAGSIAASTQKYEQGGRNL